MFLTLKDPESGATLAVTIRRDRFDALGLDLADGERVHVYGRAELYEARGTISFRALTIERFGLGAHLAALERLKKKLAAEGLFRPARKRPLPFLPRRIGLVTGTDAAAKQDVLTTITTRFPPARIVVAETPVQGARAAAGDRRGAAPGRRPARGGRDRPGARRRQLRGSAAVQRRGGRPRRRRRAPFPSSPRSATSRTRRSATSPPTCAPRRRPPRASSSSPTWPRCSQRLERARARRSQRGARRTLETQEQRLVRAHDTAPPRAARSRSSASTRALEATAPAGCVRSRRARPSGAATRSCAPATRSLRSATRSRRASGSRSSSQTAASGRWSSERSLARSGDVRSRRRRGAEPTFEAGAEGARGDRRAARARRGGARAS